MRAGPARTAVDREQLHAPHLIDYEVTSGLRRLAGAGLVKGDQAWGALDAWQSIGLIRHASTGLLRRVWELRDNVSAYDAAYVALAELLGTTLLTADARLSRAPGLRCPVTLLPA